MSSVCAGNPKTSGASGIHVHLPVLETTYTYEDVRIFAETIASIVVQRAPEDATIERVVRRRKPHHVYVDYLQNIRGKTVASVYSPRPRGGAGFDALEMGRTEAKDGSGGIHDQNDF